MNLKIDKKKKTLKQSFTAFHDLLSGFEYSKAQSGNAVEKNKIKNTLSFYERTA